MKGFKIKKYEIFISDTVLRILTEHKQLKMQNESGGILLGQVKGSKFYILRASTPSKGDDAGRTFFYRDKHSTQVIIDYEFSNSEGHTIYLGEWHTHPEANPSPSSQDLLMIKDQYEKNSINTDILVTIIQGTKGHVHWNDK